MHVHNHVEHTPDGTPIGCVGPRWHFCHLVNTQPKYREAYGIVGHAGKRELGQCVHLGPWTGRTTKCIEGCGRGTKLKLMSCEVYGVCTVSPRGEDTSGCCKDRAGNVCKSFREKLPARSVIVPQPPMLELSCPHRSAAVVTVAAGKIGRDLLEASGRHQMAYADRLGADWLVLDWPGHPSWPMSAKFMIARALDHYERIIYLDADTLCRPGCVDLLAMCAPDEIGVCDEMPYHKLISQFGRERKYKAFRKAMGFPNVPIPWMFNAGVMVLPRSARDLLLPPTGPIPVDHCAEQDWLNAQFLASGHKYRLMDRRANWQKWTSNGFEDAPPEAILHWSGSEKDTTHRVKQIRRYAELYPLPA